MALVKLGGLAQDVRGSLNGTVFSRNRGGAYTRQKVSPVQPVTAFNTNARMLFGVISKRWSTVLTDAQRAGWDAFAAVHMFVNVFGDAIKLSGIAFYQAVNRRNAQCGLAMIDTAPATWSVTSPGTCSVVAAVTAGLFTTFVPSVSATLLTNEKIYLFVTPPILGARSVQKTDFRLVNDAALGGIASGDDVFAEVNARFAPLHWATGNKLALRFIIIDTVTGANSAPVLVNYVIP